MSFYPFLLTYHTKDYIWGGERLVQKWNKVSPATKIAECWELCVSSKCQSYIKNGKFKGPLSDFLENYPESLGKKGMEFVFFPLLIKLLNAEKPLSIQVHPDDKFAMLCEGQYGKCEMWYICEADNDAEIYLGLNQDISKETLLEAIESGEIENYLNVQKVKAGESYVVPTGTLHAIRGGITLLEVQQNSDLTYRVYDYNRVDANNKKRELHIDKATDVIDYKKYVIPHQNLEYTKKDGYSERLLVENCYFTTKEILIEQGMEIYNEDSFVAITVIDGSGKIDNLFIEKGNTVFLPAATKAEINGQIKIITASV